MSSPLTISPILHFLMNLSEVPTLLSNLTLDEFKRIFAIAFKYLAIANDAFQQNQNSAHLEYKESETDNVPSTQKYEITKPLMLYVSISSYNVILSFFLKLSLEKRKALSSFILKCLVRDGVEGEDNYTNLAFIEFITRVTYSKVDLKSNILVDYSGLENDGGFQKKSWLYGNSVLTLYTNRLNGDTEVLIRRATTVTQFSIKMPKDSFPDWLLELQDKQTNIDNNKNKSDPLAQDSNDDDGLNAVQDDVIFTPSFLLTELLHNTELVLST
ncbi:unnamed protein product [Ambrosiozyma monospora]|uniref:Unnamed protein product n=1 Tax=Ambrosiozyma monospora TaxID=43982 RepID=A0ACB5U8P4_AMBMO|nr:unnamed protein product [Ambrosiozyma monospora]